MIVVGAYGQLKGRWRFLLRKSEGNLHEMKVATLTCMVLHNVCLDNGDTIPSKLNLTIDPITSQKRDRATIRDILLMKSSSNIVDLHTNQANKVREAITKKLWKEREIATACA